MPAPNLPICYRLREAIETAARDYLQANLNTLLGNTSLSVRRDVEQITVPQVSVRLSINGVELQKFKCPDGVERLNTYNGTLSFIVVSNRKANAREAIDHELIESNIRAIISQWSTLDGNSFRFPILLNYHAILWMIDSSSDYGIDTNNNWDITTINYDIKFCVRNDAWPMLPINPLSYNDCLFYLNEKLLGLNDGDAIASWTDASGNGLHAIQSTSGYQPIFKLNVNGRACVRFDGVDDFLLIPYTAKLNVAKFTVMFFFRTSASAPHFVNRVYDSSHAIWDGAGSGGKIYEVIRTSSTQSVASNNSTYNDNNWHHFAMVYDGVIAKFWMDGILQTNTITSSPLSTSNLGVYLGCFASGTCYAVDIAQVIHYSNVLSAEQILNIINSI
jgi:hypothetical protein